MTLDPAVKHFVLGLLAAILVPVTASVSSLAGTDLSGLDWHVWFLGLEAGVLVATISYVKANGLDLVKALAGGGAAVAIFASLGTYAAVAGSSQVGASPPGVPAGDTIVKAFEPGTGFDVADYCLHRAVKVYIDRTPAPERIGVERVAMFSQADYVEWLDKPDNTLALRHYTGNDGQNKTDQVQVLTAQALACMRAER